MPLLAYSIRRQNGNVVPGLPRINYRMLLQEIRLYAA